MIVAAFILWATCEVLDERQIVKIEDNPSPDQIALR